MAKHTPATPLPTCPAHLVYRSMADIGPARICNHPATGPGGVFCKRHDPATMPKRDAAGRIVSRTLLPELGEDA